MLWSWLRLCGNGIMLCLCCWVAARKFCLHQDLRLNLRLDGHQIRAGCVWRIRGNGLVLIKMLTSRNDYYMVIIVGLCTACNSWTSCFFVVKWYESLFALLFFKFKTNAPTFWKHIETIHTDVSIYEPLLRNLFVVAWNCDKLYKAELKVS